MLFFKPYKRIDNDVIAIGMQATLVLIFFMAQNVLLFNMLSSADGNTDLAKSVLGFGSLEELVAFRAGHLRLRLSHPGPPFAGKEGRGRQTSKPLTGLPAANAPPSF